MDWTEKAREIASPWVYAVHAWRGRSPEFMQTQVGRLTEKLAAFASEVERETLANERKRCLRIAAMEADYWRECDDEDQTMANIVIGALGAASNVCVAILQGTSAEEFHATKEALAGGGQGRVRE